MNLLVNGERRTVSSLTLAELVEELELDPATVATAHNREFVARPDRASAHLREDDAVEILVPMQGG